MDDTAYRKFVEHPTQTYHRRYEALRAVFVDQRSQKEVAQTFGFTYDSMRQLVGAFREYCDTVNTPVESPFFETWMSDAPLPMTKARSNRQLPIAGNSSSRQTNH